MTEDRAEAGLTQLLHLPPPIGATEEAVGPGRQGGPAAAVMGAVVALTGVLLGLAQPDVPLAWTGVALTGLGTVQIVVGVVLATLDRLDRQPPVTAGRESSGARGDP